MTILAAATLHTASKKSTLTSANSVLTFGRMTRKTFNPPRVRGGGGYYVKIQYPSSVSRGVIISIGIDPEPVL